MFTSTDTTTTITWVGITHTTLWIEHINPLLRSLVFYIDIVDSKTGKLIWQGSGSGSLSANKLTRDQLISNFVFRVMESYPPQIIKRYLLILI